MVAKWRSKVLQNLFWPALSDNRSWKPIFGLILSGLLRQVLLYMVFNRSLTLCPIVQLYADNIYKQLGTRSGPTDSPAWSGSKLIDTLMIVFLKDFFEKNNLDKISKQQKACKNTKNEELIKTF